MSAPAPTSNSSSNMINIPQLISACLDLVEKAGVIVRDTFSQGDLKVIDKAKPHPNDNTTSTSAASSSTSTSTTSTSSKAAEPVVIDDPQTIADLRSQKLILGSLQRMYPKLLLIGEEGELEVDEKETIKADVSLLNEGMVGRFPQELRNIDCGELAVFIDPLDGTKEYTAGFVEAVTVLVGITRNNKPLIGVVHVPFTKRTVWACVGVGVFGSSDTTDASSGDVYNRLIDMSVVHKAVEQRMQKDGLVLTTTRHHLTEETKTLLSKYHPGKVIYVGGAGHKSLLVLDGIADAYMYPQPGTKKWDTCAVDALLLAAGGKMTDQYGEALTYDAKPSSSAVKVDYSNIGVLATLKDHQKYILPKASL